MGTVNIVFASHGGPSNAAPVYNGTPHGVENITSSGTSQATTATAPTSGTVARIASTSDVYVKTGASPTAAAGSDFLVLGGTTLDLFLQVGDKVAVIDA